MYCRSGSKGNTKTCNPLFLDDEEDFDLNNSRFETINIHNNNIHSTTGYKPIYLFIIQMKIFIMK